MGSIQKLSSLRGEARPAGPFRPLHRLLETAATATPGAPALLPADDAGDGAATSLGELDASASRLARAIAARCRANGGPNADGDWLVAVRMAPSAGLVTTLLAAWKAGAAYLPLDAAFPAQRVQHILAEAQPALLIGDDDADGGVSFAALQREAAAEAATPLTDAETLRPDAAAQPEAVAIVLYTSGSTGVPKGVRIPQRAVLNRLRWQWREFPYAESERRCVFKTALTFVDSVCEVWGPLLQGRALVVVPKPVTQDPQQLLALLREHQIERLVLVPSLLRAILLYLETGAQKPTSLKLWVCSGESLPVELARQFFQHFPAGHYKLCNFYGSTEIMGDVTYHVLESPKDLDVHTTFPIGLPLDNTAIYLLDDDGRAVQMGKQGQLFVSGSNLAVGYVRGRDADRFVQNVLAVDPGFSLMYRTGDYARIVKGTLIYEGRTDSQVKIRGHRVDLTEIERVLACVKSADKVVVLCYKPGEMDQALVAFVTVRDQKTTGRDIELELRKQLSSYMIPQVIVMKNIPLLVNGKVDRQSLLRTFEERTKTEPGKENVEMDYNGVPEKKRAAACVLFETIASVLGSTIRSKICLESNFYELGGNSLNSVFTVTQLKKKGFVVGITEFISAKSLKEVLENMIPIEENGINKNCTSTKLKNNVYTSEMLNNSHKDAVYSIISSSFYEKADLEQWLLPHVQLSDYDDLLNKLWEPLIEKNLSFVVKKGKDVIAVAFNFDAYDEPPVEITSKLNIVFDFLEFLEAPIREEKLPQGKGHILHSFMMGTHESLSYQENISVMQFMEEQVLNIAKDRKFDGIFTTNTSPLTQQLGVDVYGYDVLNNYQVNQYVAPDGSKPFGEAPDWQTATCCWKRV